jgi:coproporphyrinogen III oxidase-like Fe-S oxidoreductase
MRETARGVGIRDEGSMRRAALTEARDELAERRRGPQRHRLLQGYPMPKLLRPAPPGELFPPFDDARPLLVGVLPHAACNPSVEGCGFCTFPHERFRVDEVRAVAGAVSEEIARSRDKYPGLSRRRVGAVYFGGGTANLTPPDAFAALCRALSSAFDVEGAELTLEGAPIYFLSRDSALLDVLAGVGARPRISMGVQTFDEAWLARMGRKAFGGEGDIARVVREARARGITTSADLLINLPGQTEEEILRDIRTAAGLGFDQICIYHLVLFRGLGTPWSRDRSLLRARPSNEEACSRWLAARGLLLSLGFSQSTLTNFERAEAASGPRRFEYERMSFHPEDYDAIGFGPGAISCFADYRRKTALKWLNAGASPAYAAAIREGRPARERFFFYDEIDLKLLYLTRKLSLTSAPREAYRARFGSDLAEDFSAEVEALVGAGLAALDERALSLTPTGMFFADSAAGLFASRRVRELSPEYYRHRREEGWLEEAHNPMG